MPESWNAPERDITPEQIALSRRKWFRTIGWTTAALAAGGIGGGVAWWRLNEGTDEQILSAGIAGQSNNLIHPARRNPAFAEVDRPLTDEAQAARYCNFYEFSRTKQVWRYVGDFQPLPWSVEVSGEIRGRRPRTFDLDDLLRRFTLEERVYRHRCVEAWAMVVPWAGFPLRELIREVDPLPTARFVRFETFNRFGKGAPWPYTEGLSIAEANNQLTFLATGMYGHPLLKQHGAPIRLVVPWKYGFKSIKSIVKIVFTSQQPATFWNSQQPREYGFWANVNPDVPHPRWSQQTERMLGTGERYQTQLYNGYGQWVADLYAD